MAITHTHEAATWMPAQPLLDYVEARGGPAAVGWERGGTCHRAYRRARVEGAISIHKADDLAMSMGMHPVEIWDEEWLRP